MNGHTRWIVVGMVALLLLPAALSAGRIQLEGPERAEEIVAASSLSLVPQMEYGRSAVRVVGPEGYEVTKHFAAGEQILVELGTGGGIGLPSGRYEYQLRLWGPPREGFREGRYRLQSDIFFVENGKALSRQDKRRELAAVRAELNLARRDLEAAQVISIKAASYSANDFIEIYDSVLDGTTSLILESRGGSGNEYGVWVIAATKTGLRIGNTYSYYYPATTPNYPLFIDAGAQTNSIVIADGRVDFGGDLNLPNGEMTTDGIRLTSSRETKRDFKPVSSEQVLARLEKIPITEWTFKDDEDAVRHIGPVAEDFHAAFELEGHDAKYLSVTDVQGVALAAIQGLNRKLQVLEEENLRLEGENAELERRLTAIEERLGVLTIRPPEATARPSPAP